MGITDDSVGDQFILQNQPLVQEETKEVHKEEGDEEPATKKSVEEEKNAQDIRTVKQLLSDGKYNIIPSFYRTLVFLKKMKREFAIVFRNYDGVVLEHAITEFN